MMRVMLLAAGVAWAGTAQAADADEVRLAKWMCAALTKAPFDPAAAIKSFPLEPMPDPVEKRSTSASLGTNTTAVSLKAKGATYDVEYRYQANEDNVNQPYGFTLQVTKEDDPSADMATKPWVRLFGKPQQRMTGWAVFSGPPMIAGMDPGFSFMSGNIGWPTFSANWMQARDIKYATEPCRRYS